MIVWYDEQISWSQSSPHSAPTNIFLTHALGTQSNNLCSFYNECYETQELLHWFLASTYMGYLLLELTIHHLPFIIHSSATLRAPHPVVEPLHFA